MAQTKSTRIEVTQLNMQKSRLAQIENLNKLNKTTNHFLQIIQEPYCFKGTLSLLPQNSRTIPYDRTGLPRAAITASKELNIEELTPICHRDLAAGLISLNNKQTAVLSVYLDINTTPVPDHLTNAIKYCKSKRYAILIGIDSNSQNSAWGHKDNKRGVKLLEYFVQVGLLVHNVGKTTLMNAPQANRSSTYL